MNRSHHNDSNDSTGIVIAATAVVVVIFIFIPRYYEAHQEGINSVIIYLCRVLLYPFTKLSPEALYVYDAFEMRAPDAVSWSQVLALMSYTGSFLRWPCAIILAYFAHSAWNASRADRYTRCLNIEGLIKNNVEVFPALAPVVNWGKNLLEEPYDTGPWKTARTPLQFAVDNGLYLLNGESVVAADVLTKDGIANERSQILKSPQASKTSLDTAKLREILTSQLGPKLPSDLHSLPDHKKGLAAAFMAFGCGQKKEALALLDQMNLSFRAPTQKTDWKLEISGADELLHRYASTQDVEEATFAHQAYTSTWLIALLIFARKKGVLPPAQFLWLRPRDRTLWYTLHQVGGRQPWAESAGPWNHFQAEEALGDYIDEAEIEEALRGIEYELYEEGWLPKHDSRSGEKR